MNESNIKLFLSHLGIHRTRSGRKWVRFPCPFATWTHPKGSDRHPSFGISIDPNDKSSYSCFTCKLHGDLPNFLWRLSKNQNISPTLKEFLAKNDVGSDEFLIQKLESMKFEAKPVEVAGISTSESVLARAPLKTKEPVYLDESELNLFEPPSEEALEYLKGPKRRLRQSTVDAWSLLWHPGARRIAVPVRDLNQRLVGISGRALDPYAKPKFLHSNGFQRDLYLFGEHKCIKGRTGYIVEGHFDAIYLWQMGYINAVAIMGGSISTIQVEKAVSLFSDIVIVPDGDAPGAATAQSIYNILKNKIHTTLVEVPDGADPDELSEMQLAEILGLPDRN